MDRSFEQYMRIAVYGSVIALGAVTTQVFAKTVTINPSQVDQTIKGFGGMNGAGWGAGLSNSQVDRAFGNGSGQIGLSIMRMRIDPSSSNWNLQVSAAKRAKTHGAILMATPWSPPAYMKSNNSVKNGGKLKSAYYDSYAAHLLKFAKYMSSKGASLYAMSIQNEPDLKTSYESCLWSASNFVSFLKKEGSRLTSLKVIAAESMNFKHSLTDPILNTSGAAKYVSIIGGHLYGTTPKDYPLARKKGKQVWMTEHYVNSKVSGNNWSSALNFATELHKSMVANFNAYVWWYIRRSYGLLTEDGSVSKRGYVMAQYAKYVRPGYKRISATEKPQSNVYVTAYKKGSGSKFVIVAVNKNDSDQQLTFKFKSGSLSKLTKYSTSSTLDVGYGGKYSVSNGKVSVWLNPKSVTTFVSQ